MKRLPTYEIGRYTVVIHPHEFNIGSWRAGYSIHDGSVIGAGNIFQLPVVASRSILAESAPLFSTPDEAIDDAVATIATWVANNP